MWAGYYFLDIQSCFVTQLTSFYQSSISPYDFLQSWIIITLFKFLQFTARVDQHVAVETTECWYECNHNLSWWLVVVISTFWGNFKSQSISGLPLHLPKYVKTIILSSLGQQSPRCTIEYWQTPRDQEPTTN